MKKEHKSGKNRTLKNIFHAFGLMWGINKKAILHSALSSAADYFGWVFYSLFFIRYLIGALERQESFFFIVRYVLFTGVLFAIFYAYLAYSEGTFRPIAENT
jgi:ATP-binding cassette subfamily B protein